MNKALGEKIIWRIYLNPNMLWVCVLKDKYLDSKECDGIIILQDTLRGFAIWNFILDYREVTTNHLAWQVGDEESISFWKDSWNGLPTLQGNGDYQDLIDIFISLWGDKLSSFFEVKMTTLG